MEDYTQDVEPDPALDANQMPEYRALNQPIIAASQNVSQIKYPASDQPITDTSQNVSQITEYPMVDQPITEASQNVNQITSHQPATDQPITDESQNVKQMAEFHVFTEPITDESQSVDQSGTPTLSKRMMKKLQKKERWLANKFEKRAEEREKKKAKRRAAIEQGLALPPNRKKLKKNRMADSLCHQRVAIDCSFDDLMSEKDVFNMVRQINHSYAANRRADNPLQFYVTGVEKKTKARLESLADFKYWDVNFSEQDYRTEFGAESIVYLTSESPNVLGHLDDHKVYVIGGLVDHNHHKGLCLRLAEERGIAHAQLPISEYVNMKTRKVLSVNQVFEILLYYTECRSWQDAFFRAIPNRKGVASKNQEMSESAEGTPSDQRSVEYDQPNGKSSVLADDAAGVTTDNAVAGPDSADYVANNAKLVAENAVCVAENARCVVENAMCVAENARCVAQNAMSVVENARKVADNAKRVADNAKRVADQAKHMTDNGTKMRGSVSRMRGSARHMAGRAAGTSRLTSRHQWPARIKDEMRDPEEFYENDPSDAQQGFAYENLTPGDGTY